MEAAFNRKKKPLLILLGCAGGLWRMFLLLYGAWFVFNGRVTGEIALFGLPVCALTYLFAVKFLSVSPKNEWAAFKKLGGMLRYAGFMLAEIVKANVGVLRLILNPKFVAEPRIVTITPDLKTDTARTLLADSITLTPGTITVDLKGERLTVHCLDESMAEGLQDSEMEKRLRALEEK